MLWQQRTDYYITVSHAPKGHWPVYPIKMAMVLQWLYRHLYQIQVSDILQLVQRQRPFTQGRVRYFKKKQYTGSSILEDDKDAGMLKWRLLYPVQISDTLQWLDWKLLSSKHAHPAMVHSQRVLSLFSYVVENHWKYFWLYFLARRRKIGDFFFFFFFARIGIISFYSFYNVPWQDTALKRKLIHHTTQRACRRQFVGLRDHVKRSNHLWLQYRKTLLWRTVDVHASTFTQYASHGRYFKLLKRCIKLSRFKYRCFWMKHWSVGGLGWYLQHSATADYKLVFCFVVVFRLYCDWLLTFEAEIV